MEKQKVLCYLQSVGSKTRMEAYAQERKKKITQAHNVEDFFHKAELGIFSEIIFDYLCVLTVYQRGNNFKPIAEKTKLGVTVKIIEPVTPMEIKHLQPDYRSRLIREVKEIKEKLFD